MSFFGFNTALPRDGSHNQKAPGFGPTVDPFAGLAGGDDDDGEALDFEETYDGLGNELDEGDDALNDDTFGGAAANETRQNASSDFNFGERTSLPAAQPPRQHEGRHDTKQSTSIRHAPPLPPQPQQAPKISQKPARSGYEHYQANPGYIPQLEANASIWGIQPKTQTPPAPLQQSQQAQSSSLARKIMSLEEVEAAMRSQSKVPIGSSQSTPHPPGLFDSVQGQAFAPPPQRQYEDTTHLRDIPQNRAQHNQAFSLQQSVQADPRFQSPQILQRPQPASFQQPLAHPPNPVPNESRPRQIPSNPNGVAQNIPAVLQHAGIPQATSNLTAHSRGPSHGGRPIVHPDQVMQMSEEERAAFLAEEAQRAKRNHKIHILSKGNGLMTPQDKNFITRIQLQQLVTATGGAEEQGPESALAEDFYYQVFSQIRGAPRQNPNNHFAQTYLHQTGGRAGNRRYPRGGDSHMRRMEQQVQRAVEAAKLKPKNKQLVIEGSLGKISFSNANTPKPLLNLKRKESQDGSSPSKGTRSKMRPMETAASRKAVLRDIETLYSTLMNMEDHERRIPPPPKEESSADEIQEHIEWRQQIQKLNQQLWQELKVMEPIVPNSPTPHPFIAILSHSKGKKLMPRVFRQIDDQQRLTVLTMIVVHLDLLDVVRLPQSVAINTTLPRPVRDAIDLFSQAVMPNLFSYVNEAPLGIIIGMIGLIIDRVSVPVVVRTKVGLGLLTMFVSRAELTKQASTASHAKPQASTTEEEEDWTQWTTLYNRLFDLVEPHLPLIFPGAINTVEDLYVWQFLAAMGIGASPEQQQRLVLGVKERVMETVGYAKALPGDNGRGLLDNVNLFMRAIGLDVELLG